MSTSNISPRDPSSGPASIASQASPQSSLNVLSSGTQAQALSHAQATAANGNVNLQVVATEAGKTSISTTAGPDIRKVAEWDTGTPGTHERLEFASSEVIAQRALSFVTLVRALLEGKFDEAQVVLDGIPPDVEHFDLYFPASSGLGGYEALSEAAQDYDRAFPSATSERLLHFTDECELRSKVMNHVLLEQQHWPEAKLDRVSSKEVAELCLTFKNTSELAVEAEHVLLADLIHNAVTKHGEDLPAQLATQPYANLRMLQMKCGLLNDHMDAAQLSLFRKHVTAALSEQTHASALLKKQLLKDDSKLSFYMREVARLARIEYAKQVTSLPIDYVSSGATWRQLSTMQTSCRKVHDFYATKGELFDVETTAIRWVLDQMDRTAASAN